MKFSKACFLAVLLVPGIAFASKKAVCPPADVVENEVVKTTGDRVPDSYTIVFDLLESGQSLEETANQAISKTGGEVDKDGFLPIINGVLVTMAQTQADAMAKRPEVKYIQENARFRASSSGCAVEAWGLDRIDQPNLPLDGFFKPANAFEEGEGTVVYVIDTGILPDHQEFSPQGRAFTSAEYDFLSTTEEYDYGGDQSTNGIDCHGHGTHVAGTIGGVTVGVAPRAKLVAVRALNCKNYGVNNAIFRATRKVMEDCPEGTSVPGTPFPCHRCIVNLSVGGSYDMAWNEYTTKLSEQGILVVVAASNDGADACLYSPGSAVGAFTVGATTSNDTRWTYTCPDYNAYTCGSNYGPAVDLFAPGKDIRSAWIGGTDSFATGSGTSFAAPHVAGVAALILGENPHLTAEQVKEKIIKDSTKGVLKTKEDFKETNSPNRLLYINDATVKSTNAIPYCSAYDSHDYDESHDYESYD